MINNESTELCCKIGSETVVSTEIMPQNLSLAMSYVPYQQFSKVYSNEEALINGTLFPELDKPFMRAAGGMRNE